MAGSDARTSIDLAMASNTSRGCSLMRVRRPATATLPSAIQSSVSDTSNLSDLNYALVPAQQIFLEPPCDTEDQQHHHENQKNQCEHQGGVVGALRKRQEVAEAVGCRHELSHAGAGEGKADRDFQIAEHPGRDRRQVDVAYKRPAIAAECDDAFDKPAVHLPDSGENSGEDQHSHENEGQCDFGGQSDTEPD